MIVAVAIRFGGKVWSLPKPSRHHDVIALIAREAGVSHVDAHGDDQGFLDDCGHYLRRGQALVHALLCNQVKDPKNVRCDMLFSEDVW